LPKFTKIDRLDCPFVLVEAEWRLGTHTAITLIIPSGVPL